jgi:hypothetical protein
MANANLPSGVAPYNPNQAASTTTDTSATTIGGLLGTAAVGTATGLTSAASGLTSAASGLTSAASGVASTATQSVASVYSAFSNV